MKTANVLLGVATSDRKLYCQSEFLTRIIMLKGSYDILIVENSYSNDNYNRLKMKFHNFPNVVILRGKSFRNLPQQAVWSRNKVLKYAQKQKYEFLFSVDSDVIVPEDALIKLLDVLRLKKADYVAGVYWSKLKEEGLTPIVFFKREDVKSGYADELLKKRWSKSKVIEINGAGLGCTLFRIKILKDFKFSATKQTLDDDIRLNKWLLKKNVRMFCDLSVGCIHKTCV